MSDDGIEVSEGRVADPKSVVENVFPAELIKKFEVRSYRNAATILKLSFPDQFKAILNALNEFEINTSMIREPGGSKGPIAKYVDELFDEKWQETRIVADLNVRLLHAKKRDEILRQYTREGFLDGHRIDFVNGKVAFDLEWNSKDQTYDRDLYAFSAFYEAGAIDVGIILTRGNTMDNAFFRSLGKVLKRTKDASGNDVFIEGSEEVYKKFGASTTWMGKLLYRLDAGRNGGCPVLAIGITPKCVSDWSP